MGYKFEITQYSWYAVHTDRRVCEAAGMPPTWHGTVAAYDLKQALPLIMADLEGFARLHLAAGDYRLCITSERPTTIKDRFVTLTPPPTGGVQ